MTYMAERVEGSGGVIVLGRTGDVGRYFTTERMAWASVSGSTGTLHYGIEPGEDSVDEDVETAASLSGNHTVDVSNE